MARGDDLAPNEVDSASFRRRGVIHFTRNEQTFRKTTDRDGPTGARKNGVEKMSANEVPAGEKASLEPALQPGSSHARRGTKGHKTDQDMHAAKVDHGRVEINTHRSFISGPKSIHAPTEAILARS